MHEPRDPDEIARLAQAFVRAQRAAPGQDGTAVAERIATASPEVWRAAMYWLSNNRMPDEPVVHGYSPRSLVEKKGLVPSAALTALMALEEDPSAALITLKHMSDRHPVASEDNPGPART